MPGVSATGSSAVETAGGWEGRLACIPGMVASIPLRVEHGGVAPHCSNTRAATKRRTRPWYALRHRNGRKRREKHANAFSTRVATNDGQLRITLVVKGDIRGTMAKELPLRGHFLRAREAGIHVPGQRRSCDRRLLGRVVKVIRRALLLPPF